MTAAPGFLLPPAFPLLALLLMALPSACRPSAPAPPSAGTPSTAARNAPAGTTASGTTRADTASTPEGTARATVRTIPLTGPLSKASAEVSGLAWHGDDLVLLPQHPFRISGRAEHGLLFTLPKQDIEAFLSGRRDGPLRPHPVTLLAPQLEERAPGYQGCEALSMQSSRAYLAIEAGAGAAMRGFLFSGQLTGDTLRFDTNRRATLPPQTDAGNMAYEALLSAPDEGATPGQVVALYEANGRNVNPQPQAPVFSAALQPLRTLPFPPLEYRLTDATRLDASGRFWAMNYFFPGEREKLRPAPDPLSKRHGTAPHRTGPLERLVEFQWDEAGIRRTSSPPMRLSLLPGTPRNWEGLARFRSAARGPGFLLATDQYPETLLGFVPGGQAE